jgi:hypothetical protein
MTIGRDRVHMKSTPSLFFVLLFSLTLIACGGSGSGGQTLNKCVVSGTVETTVVEGTTTYTDIPNTELRVDSSRQNIVSNLNAALISGFGKSVTGYFRWTGEVNLDSVAGQESGIQHSARIFYDLNTGDLNGLVLLPTDSDVSGTIPVTLNSEYQTGAVFLRTRYGFGINQNYVQTSDNIIMDWSYSRDVNELVFSGTGSFDLGETSPILGWKAYPVVSICLSASLTL